MNLFIFKIVFAAIGFLAVGEGLIFAVAKIAIHDFTFAQFIYAQLH